MPVDLFYKIVDDLCEMNFKGKILPYNRNEPLTDPFIFDRLKYIRKKLPKATIYFSTNGVLLDKEKIENLLELEPIEIRISLHAFSKEKCLEIMGIDNTKVFRNISYIVELIKKRKIGNPTKKFHIVMVAPSAEEELLMREYFKKFGYSNYFSLEIWPLVSRAGKVEYDKFADKKTYHEKIFGCKQGRENNINSWFHICTDGKVILCCQDWFEELVLGNMKLQTINEVWNGKKYLETLDKVFGRQESESDFICKKCESAITAPGAIGKFKESYIIPKLKMLSLATIKKKIKILLLKFGKTRA